MLRATACWLGKQDLATSPDATEEIRGLFSKPGAENSVQHKAAAIFVPSASCLARLSRRSKQLVVDEMFQGQGSGVLLVGLAATTLASGKPIISFHVVPYKCYDLVRFIIFFIG